MRQYHHFKADISHFKKQLLHWAANFEMAFYLDSNQYPHDRYAHYECLVAVHSCIPDFDSSNTFAQIQQLHNNSQDWIFGWLTYDLKNQIEPLHSNNFDGLAFPVSYFFQPEIIITLQHNGQATLGILPTTQHTFTDILHAITQQNTHTPPSLPITMQPRMTAEDYTQRVITLQNHIRRGDIYEINLCQEWWAEQADIHPLQVFEQLNQHTRAPFAAFVRHAQHYAMCASPERFLQKTNDQIVAQPIKGTIRRDLHNPIHDQQLQKILKDNPKERSENVMIVDLVRNDLSRIAQRGTVEVAELFGVYRFLTVHHLISTITARLSPTYHLTDLLQTTFPMGSMTGAPKFNAMQLIEQYELTQRSLYSGSMLYITPNGDMDSNVVIRSLLYNANERYLSFQVGSAITHYATPDMEYAECLLKAQALLKAVGTV